MELEEWVEWVKGGQFVGRKVYGLGLIGINLVADVQMLQVYF